MKNLIRSAALAAAVVAFPALASASGCSPAPDSLVSTLVSKAPGLRSDVLRLALDASRCAAAEGLVRRPELLTVIDYSIPSTEPRLWVFDVPSRKLLFREHVAHGVNSGGNLPTKFSNDHGSRQTSLGLFVTGETYVGSNGYSLRMDGLERGVNDEARDRAIVMHGAPYVDAAAAKKQGRLGRSWGCPAVRSTVARKMIDTLRGGSPIFAYYPEKSWLSASRFLDAPTGGGTSVAVAAVR